MKRLGVAIVLGLSAMSVSEPAWAEPMESTRRTPTVIAVERATPAVVTIEVTMAANNTFRMFDPGQAQSAGSGVIIDPRGIVLTNAHVVDGATEIKVTLSDGRRFDAELMAQESAIDLAVLRLTDARNLPTIPLGDSDSLFLGEPAIAIGNPYGLGLTVSTGVLASTGRDVNVGTGPTQSYLQTDAAINPGNSGGALVNINGELIGINTFIHAGAQSIGFAIPVNRARKIASDLISYGHVNLPWLGLSLLDPEGRVPGPLVVELWTKGPARRAGLALDDRIIGLNGHSISTRADLNARLAEVNPGKTVTLEIRSKDGSTRMVDVTTSNAPGNLAQSAITETLAVSFRDVRGGVQVTEVGDGSWRRAGLREGDIVTWLDGERITDTKTLVERLQQAKADHRIQAWFTVVRGRAQGSRAVRI